MYSLQSSHLFTSPLQSHSSFPFYLKSYQDYFFLKLIFGKNLGLNSIDE